MEFIIGLIMLFFRVVGWLIGAIIAIPIMILWMIMSGIGEVMLRAVETGFYIIDRWDREPLSNRALPAPGRRGPEQPEPGTDRDQVGET